MVVTGVSFHLSSTVAVSVNGTRSDWLNGAAISRNVLDESMTVFFRLDRDNWSSLVNWKEFGGQTEFWVCDFV